MLERKEDSCDDTISVDSIPSPRTPSCLETPRFINLLDNCAANHTELFQENNFNACNDSSTYKHGILMIRDKNEVSEFEETSYMESLGSPYFTDVSNDSKNISEHSGSDKASSNIAMFESSEIYADCYPQHEMENSQIDLRCRILSSSPEPVYQPMIPMVDIECDHDSTKNGTVAGYYFRDMEDFDIYRLVTNYNFN